MPDITMCLGVITSNNECPVKDGCYRYKAEPTPNWQSYFVQAPFDVKSNSCEHIVQIVNKDEDPIEPIAIKLADIIERTIRKHNANKSTFDKVLYILEQRDVFGPPSVRPMRKALKRPVKKKINREDVTWPELDPPQMKQSCSIVGEKPKWKTNVLDLSGECES